MNKRTFLILALVAALALPTAAMAAAEFSLGGFIKLEAFWDSTQDAKGMINPIGRNNNMAPTMAAPATRSQFHHGRMKFTSQGSRFNFTIKGPKVWGATTTGFLEMDFDAAETGLVGLGGIAGGAAVGATNAYTPRLRHAMFRFNWPETELLFGQYWGFLSDWWVELNSDGQMTLTGIANQRLPQIRLTQKFLGAWTVGVLVGEANAITGGHSFSAVDRLGGESTEAPQVQARVEFAQDLYGKAPWYGKPTPLTVQLNAGWQRGITPSGGAINEADLAGLGTTGENNYTAVARVGTEYTRRQYVDPWIVMSSFFIPVIPTHSANLAGTASLQTNLWIGQGVEAFGIGAFGSQVYRWQGTDAAGVDVYRMDLVSRWGTQVQAQYYFTNQWFLTGVFGFSKTFDVGAFQTDVNAPNNKRNAFSADVANYHQEYHLCLWYRPITAVKFGLQYSFRQTNYFQNVGQTATQANFTNVGDAHRVDFVGLFFF